LNTVREDLPWKEVEREKGTLVVPPAFDTIVNRIISNGLLPLIVLDYGNPFYDHGDKPISDEAVTAYARYAEFIAQHFKGRVKMLEVWNEWGGTTGKTHHGTPDSYVKLLIPTYSRIKAVDPSITVIGGAVSSQDLHNGWLKGMLNSGGISHVDGISIHTYTYYQEDESKRTADAWKAFVLETEHDIQSITGRANFPLYITEMGWPTHVGPKATGPDLAADYFTQMLFMARTMPFVKGLWKYDFRDDGPNQADPENNFGLITYDSRPKPEFAAIKAVSKLVETATFTGQVSDAEPGMEGVRFKTVDGRLGAAVWSQKTTTDVTDLRVRELGIDKSKAEIHQVRQNPDQAQEDARTSSVVKVTRTPTVVLGPKVSN
jgi:endo-1,4-beta-mannosidase